MSAGEVRRELQERLRAHSALMAADATEALAEEAIRQGLAALVLDACPWTPVARSRLDGARLAALARNVRLLDLARRLAAALAAAGVRALPMKGTALLAMGCGVPAPYDSEADRPMADLDLLVLDDWGAAMAAADAEGLTPLAASDHAQPFLDPSTGEMLELHVAPTSCPDLFPQDADALWSRARTGASLLPRVPSPEDLLVQLALHAAFQHGLVLRLGQWLDFRRLLERTLLDRDRLLAIAMSARAVPALWAALDTARRVVAAPVPPDLERELDRQSPTRLRRWLASREPFDFVAPAPPALVRLRLELARGQRARLVALTLTARRPGEAIGTGGLIRRVLQRALNLGWRVVLESGRRVAQSLARGSRRWRVAARPGPESEAGMPPALAILQASLEQFPFARLSVTGSCMEPLLRAGEKVVLARRAPRLGDIVLTRSVKGLRLHRLVFAPPALRGVVWRTKADRALLLDPAIARADVLATVVAIEGRPGVVRNRRRALLSLAEGVWCRLRGADAA
jgi:hypothetical protein